MRKTLLVGATALALVATQVSQAEEQAGNTIWSGFTDFFNPNWQPLEALSRGTRARFDGIGAVGQDAGLSPSGVVPASRYRVWHQPNRCR